MKPKGTRAWIPRIDLAEDVKDALRAVRKRPGFSLTVALTLAFGVGINATVLAMADALLRRPFPFEDYDRLAVLWEVERGASERQPAAPANFRDWRSGARGFERLAAWEWWDTTLAAGDGPERVQGFRVSPGFFELLGIHLPRGRPFAP